MEAWGAQMELRAIQRRNRNATVKTRAAGRPKGKPSYGFRYVRVVMGGKIDHVDLHPHASTVVRLVARRILYSPTGRTHHAGSAIICALTALPNPPCSMLTWSSNGADGRARRDMPVAVAGRGLMARAQQPEGARACATAP
ncbi:hypothetical protein Sgleb_07780 [Streptomyces glebosus]|uniref:Uncharacterized protein n=1 Tax=Streptomyces glebosus TaxID=249580 RepID=A0A640SR39_9ACTN|nr:hypothetical protein Sgleb_07780 [Streptomyces glebosus]GHG74899.1 hypothetical protein GCM10010513_49060 [Streptomyces glebosus]